MVYPTMGGGLDGAPSYKEGNARGSYDRTWWTSTGTMDEPEIGSLITKERLISDQHKANYQKLKYDHTKLKDAFASAEQELAKTSDADRLLTARYRQEIVQLEKKITELQGDAELLRRNQMTSQRLDLLKAQVTEDLDRVYADRFERVHVEDEKYRSDLVQCKVEFEFCKAEFDKESAQHKRVFDDLQLMREAEVHNLREERDLLLFKLLPCPNDSADKLFTMHRENNSLLARIKTLSTEIEEIKASAGTQSSAEQGAESQVKEIEMVLSTCRTLEGDHEKLKREADRLTQELAMTSEEISSGNREMERLRRSVASSKQDLEKAELKARSDFTQAKLEEAKLKGEAERTRDKLAGDIEAMQFSIQRSTACCAQLERAISLVDTEASRKEAQIREEGRVKLMTMGETRSKIETHLENLEIRGTKGELEMKQRIERAVENKKQAESSLLNIQSEMGGLRARLDAILESELRSATQKVTASAESAAQQESRLNEGYTRLAELQRHRDETQQLTNEIARLKSREAVTPAQREAASAERFAEWQLTRGEMERRLHELELELKATAKERELLFDDIKTRKKKYKKYFYSQKEKLELTEANLAKAETENAILKPSVHRDEYRQRTRQLRDLKRRHQEFLQVLCGPVSYPIPAIVTQEQEERHHQEDLRFLRQQIDRMNSMQKEAMSGDVSDKQ